MQGGGVGSVAGGSPQAAVVAVNDHTVRLAKGSDTAKIKAWGDMYGLFLGRYEVVPGQPKHLSPTCCVVFAKDFKAVDACVTQAVLPGGKLGAKQFYPTIEALLLVISAGQGNLEGQKQTVLAATKAGNTHAGLKIGATGPSCPQVHARPTGV